MRKIVLTTIGSLGDLHPFIAIGLALRERGFQAVLAVPEDHLAKCRAAGLDAVSVMPSFETIRERMGLGEEAAVRRIMVDQHYLLENVLLPWLGAGAEALDAAAADADALVGSLFMFAAPMIAEKRRIPLVTVVLQPMTMFSAYDPPRTPDFRMLKGAPVGHAGLVWNRMIYTIMRNVLRARYGRLLNSVRASHGLAPRVNAILLDPGGTPSLTLCCYSPLLGPLGPDAPAHARLIGFPVFDSEAGRPERLDPKLDAFLAAGKPPIVFTLGSLATAAPGSFYEEAAAVAGLLGERAVLLTGYETALPTSDAIIGLRYAPHSGLFPRAAAIVHHGGIGTVGQALRAGKPQLVVPHMGDQNDNAHRVERIGVGRSLPAKRFTAARAAPIISSLIADQGIRAEAVRIGRLVAIENGAQAAAIAIERVARA